MEMNAHTCIQREAERDSRMNEAEIVNSILGCAASIGSSITNDPFKNVSECMKKLESDLEDRLVSSEEVEKDQEYCAFLGR